MNRATNKILITSTKGIALTAVMAATIVGAKLALFFLPNIEIVTLLIGVYSYCFGFLGVLASVVFVFCEMAIWGMGTWVLPYFIHWPLVGIVFCLLAALKIKNKIVLTSVAALLTVCFSLLTSFVDIGLLIGYFDNFFERFIIYYSRGIAFYIAHIVSVTVGFILLFKPLERVLTDYKKNSTI